MTKALHHDASTTPSGPFLLLRGTFKGVQVYSILVVYPPSMKEMQPELTLSIGTVQAEELIDVAFDYSFWRFTVHVPLTSGEQKVEYTIKDMPTYAFKVPGMTQPWRWGFFSCNGFSSDVPEARRKKYNGIQPLWQDVLNEHQHKGLHVLIGGGDQLYFDALFERVPELTQWAKIPDKMERKEAPFPKELEHSTSWFYMNHYLHGFMEDKFAQALAQIPSCMAWDDHDIFDGYGSYPDYLQESKYFKGIFASALRFYLLFQHHTTPELAKKQDGYIGAEGFHKIVPCGNDLVIVLPDTRTERNLTHIISPASYDLLFQEMEQLTPKPKQVLFIAPIPMLYPHSESHTAVKWAGTGLKVAASAVQGVGQVIRRESEMKQFFENTKIFKSAVNRFGEPELLDDLLDHWTCSYHISEKVACLNRFQNFALVHQCRITLVSGDVHLAACGRAFRVPVPDTFNTVAAHDPYAMFQIVSSGIGNLPPPSVVAWSLDRGSKKNIPLDDHTTEQIIPLFQVDPMGKSNPCRKQKFLRRRNWALGELRPEGGMNVWICVEKVKGQLSGETQRYFIDVVDVVNSTTAT